MSVLELLKSDRKITPALMRMLGEALDQQTSLDLSQQELTTPQLILLYRALEENESITSLNLSRPTVPRFYHWGYEARALASMLEKNHTITDINLKDYGLLSAGTAILIPALKQNKILKSLNLEGNVLNDEGMIALSSVLEKNHNLERLYLGRNVIKIPGMQALAAALKNNSGLKHLDLDTNSGLEGEGVLALVSALKENKSLISLRLNKIRIKDQDLDILSEFLKKNESLTHLDLGTLVNSEKTLKKLAEALEANKTLISLRHNRPLAMPYGAIFNDIDSYVARNKAKAYKAQTKEIIEGTSFPDVVANIISEYVDPAAIRDLPVPPPRAPKPEFVKQAPTSSSQLLKEKKPKPWLYRIVESLQALWNFIKEKLGFKRKEGNAKQPMDFVIGSEEASVPPTVVPIIKTSSLTSESKKHSKELEDLIDTMKKKTKRSH